MCNIFLNHTHSYFEFKYFSLSVPISTLNKNSPTPKLFKLHVPKEGSQNPHKLLLNPIIHQFDE